MKVKIVILNFVMYLKVSSADGHSDIVGKRGPGLKSLRDQNGEAPKAENVCKPDGQFRLQFHTATFVIYDKVSPSQPVILT